MIPDHVLIFVAVFVFAVGVVVGVCLDMLFGRTQYVFNSQSSHVADDDGSYLPDELAGVFDDPDDADDVDGPGGEA